MVFIGCRPFFNLEGKSLLNKLKLQTGIFVLTAFLLGCNEFMIVGIISDLAQSFNVSLSCWACWLRCLELSMLV